ncbi:MAG: 50S ribosomal protein L11 methyltransferase [Ignavibacterium sp.]|uniref:50S ribosomal protein L11 methyltransferase n=1 Tax=Ignavibacterium sp. TaxID=2651167 RepID=UPI00404A454A
MSKSYKEFLITAEPLNVEILSSVLWELNIDGISEEINCIKVFTHDNSISESTIKNALEQLKKNKLIRNYEVQENVLYEKNWNEEWEKSREVIHISERIVIKPTFKQYEPKGNEIVITLDPKMSFGTGEHPTTKICISFLEKYIRTGMKVLDVGSGTAILSIVAAKLGASKVVAFDIDEWALANGAENVKLNQVDNIVEVRLCKLNNIEENNFDLIVGNIQRNILIELAQEIKKRIKQNGVLILSGLLEMDRDAIIKAFTSVGFDEVDFMKMDEWIGIVFKSQ